MRQIDDLVTELKQFFSNTVSLTEEEVAIFLSQIIDDFKKDFPEIRSKYIQNPTSEVKKFYLHEIDEKIISLDKVIESSYLSGVYDINLLQYNMTNAPIIDIQELTALNLYNQILQDFLLNKKAYHPPIFTDSTGEYFVINSNVFIFYKRERELNLMAIPEYIYKPLYHYAYYKMIDFMLMEDNKYRQEIIAQIMNDIYNQFKQDMTNEEVRDVASLSLGSMSISFKSTPEMYSSILSRLAQTLKVDPTLAKQLDKMKTEHLQKYRRKKFLYYSGAY